MAEAAGIEIRNLYKIFGPTPDAMLELVRGGMGKAELNEKHGHVLGLDDINITMKGGHIQVIMGLSGSGKSTLIRHINRLIDPTAGQVLAGEDDVTAMSPEALRAFRRHKTAMVFQKFALLPNQTVIENAAYGLEIQGMSRARRQAIAERWIARVGLAGYESRYPNQLSGGMQQRVGLARALANDAPILLMDEAFSALDPLIRTDMQTVLLELQQEIRKTIVFITHDLDEALRLGDSIAILRDGRVIQQGTSQDIVLRPADDYVANFVREVNRGRVIHADRAMQPLSPDDRGEGATLPAKATLDEAMKSMIASGAQRLVVTGPEAQPLGVLTPEAIIAAMVGPEGGGGGGGEPEPQGAAAP